MGVAGVDVAVVEQELVQREEAEVFVDACLRGASAWEPYDATLGVVVFLGGGGGGGPVGFQVMRPLKRPVSSWSVQGSLRRSSCSVVFCSGSATRADVFECEVEMGEAALEILARFRGGIVVDCGCLLECCSSVRSRLDGAFWME